MRTSLWMKATGRPVEFSLALAAVVTILASGAAPAFAVEPGPGWAISTVAQPTNFSSSRNAECAKAVAEEGHALEGIPSQHCDRFMVTVPNAGSQPSQPENAKGERQPATIALQLPRGMTAVSIAAGQFEEGLPAPKLECDLSTVSCTASEPVPPGRALAMVVDVEASAEASGTVTGSATVSGGGATTVTALVSATINAGAAAFGVAGFQLEAAGVDGALDTRAGDHPYALTTNLQFNTTKYPTGEVGPEGGTVPLYLPVQDAKDIVVDIPPGLVGNPQATPRCPAYLNGGGCPTSTIVGAIGIDGEYAESPGVERHPIYNLVPEHGYPAEFGFTYLSHDFVMYASVTHASSGYGLRVTVPGLPRLKHSLEITGITLTFFGDPAVQDGGATSPAAFFTNPMDCTAGPLNAKVAVDSWQNPGVFVSKETTSYQHVIGCNALQFQPTIALQPETTQADEPSGYNVDLNVPQALNVFPVPATAELKKAVVTLPEGVSVSPSAADGLVGCQETGPEGIDIPKGGLPPDKAGEGETIGADGLSHLMAGHCPGGSTLGTVEITTPLLAGPLHGHVYLAQPKCGGAGQPACTEASASNGELFRLYIEAEGSGVVIKLPGTVSADPATGRLTATFANNPQLPFSDLRLQFKGGPRAPLANPQACGSFTTTSELSPWSAPETPDATPSSSFAVSCPGSTAFNPSFTAGTITPNAGGFSPFTLTFARRDREQDLSGISVRMPPGLLGKLSTVEQCPEPQASQGACAQQSMIGHATVGAGPGSQPYYVNGGVFLTGPYKGAPFGLSIVVPAVAGPFNLGNVIVRATINIDPHTAQITATSDPLPQIIDGVPLRLQNITVTTDRPGFMFNPTNCEAQTISAKIAAAQGATASVSSPFAVGGCKSLPFKPSFSASTQGKTSKVNGASLTVKITQQTGEANIHKVNLQLPISLPSRLTTLQKACTEAQFNANPAGCPEGSFIGTATASTPVLSVPLTGPAILVSHGGAAFPDVVFVLQGEGIRIDLVGNTDIKKGITFSRFETVPDAPISSFETSLPEGPHSVLGANTPANAKGSFCSSKLLMPTTITGQNGAVVTQSTNIAVTGCGKPSIKITKAKIEGNTVLVTVTTTQQGTVTVSGNGLKTIKKTLGAGAHQLKVSLTKNGRTARKHHKKIKVKASVKDSNGSSSKTMTLKL
jgi:hypothetical protein